MIQFGNNWLMCVVWEIYSTSLLEDLGCDHQHPVFYYNRIFTNTLTLRYAVNTCQQDGFLCGWTITGSLVS